MLCTPGIDCGQVSKSKNTLKSIRTKGLGGWTTASMAENTYKFVILVKKQRFSVLGGVVARFQDQKTFWNSKSKNTLKWISLARCWGPWKLIILTFKMTKNLKLLGPWESKILGVLFQKYEEFPIIGGLRIQDSWSFSLKIRRISNSWSPENPGFLEF